MSFSRVTRDSSRWDRERLASLSCCCRDATVASSCLTSPSKLQTQESNKIKGGGVVRENKMRQGLPELGLIPAELHVGSEGAEVKSGLNHSPRSLLVMDGLLQSHDVPLLSLDLLQDLQTEHGNMW